VSLTPQHGPAPPHHTHLCDRGGAGSESCGPEAGQVCHKYLLQLLCERVLACRGSLAALLGGLLLLLLRTQGPQNVLQTGAWLAGEVST
jgi:hypothetical protein